MGVPTVECALVPNNCVLRPLREKQRQHGSGWRPSTGRAWRPGRIQPKNAPTTQCYQAAEGGRAGEEPHSEQHLRRADFSRHPAVGSTSLLAEATCGFLRLVIKLCEKPRVHPSCFLSPFEYIKAPRLRISFALWA